MPIRGYSDLANGSGDRPRPVEGVSLDDRIERSVGTRSGAQARLLPLTYSVPEVAALLGINRNTAYELVARGQIPSLRLGKRVLVVRAALELLLETAMPRA
jgi:excisionase family DNA binding protein